MGLLWWTLVFLFLPYGPRLRIMLDCYCCFSFSQPNLCLIDNYLVINLEIPNADDETIVLLENYVVGVEARPMM